MKYEVIINGARRQVNFTRSTEIGSALSAVVDGRRVDADVARISSATYSILLNGRSIEVTVDESANGLLLRVAGKEFEIEIVDPRVWRGRHGGTIELEGRQEVRAPMSGKIVSVLVTAGQSVEAGQGLLVVEAMKMQNEVRSPKTGTVERIHFADGNTVGAGEILAVIS